MKEKVPGRDEGKVGGGRTGRCSGGGAGVMCFLPKHKDLSSDTLRPHKHLTG